MFESGMEILRADFHLHTKADKEFKYNGEENSYINNYIDELFAQGIRVAVLTNHNKFDMEEYKALKRKAAKKDILILPGVELSVKEGSNGVHTLIIFDPDSWIENGNNHIASFLSGAFAGISNYESENAKCKYDLHTVISELDAYGKDYIPDIKLSKDEVNVRYGLKKEWYSGVVAELPMISVNADELVIVKAKDADSKKKIKNALKQYQKNLMENMHQYPANQLKVQASKVYVKGNYVCFFVLGSIDSKTEQKSDEKVIAAYKKQNEKAVNAIKKLYK